ncbi:MAG: alanine dehydrogenase [Synergistaceae bacterium]|jgi:alanine dehydrogenase|nr:alanine dehydrogenase [Synergistaceae bacterium]
MKIGCPKEIKNREYRVGITPAATLSYVRSGHSVYVEHNAGLQSGFTDNEYVAAGAVILDSAESIWKTCEMIVKVKEPLPDEYPLMRDSQLIYTYFHLAANRELTEACLKSNAICVAYELVAEPWGLPLLQPMSEVAGRMSVIMASFYLGKTFGGSGVLSMGVPGVAPAKVFVLGGGVVGANAAKIAAGLGARVVIADVNHRRLEYLSEIMPANCVTIYSNPHSIANEIADSDIVIGSVLLPGGAAAPKLITREHLSSMVSGSVFVDVAIDQGGVAETSRPTTHDDPVFIEEGVVHYCVANMPGAYARTSTMALSNATGHYGLMLADKGAFHACQNNAALCKGLAVYCGKLTVPAVAEAFDMWSVFADPEAVLS